MDITENCYDIKTEMNIVGSEMLQSSTPTNSHSTGINQLEIPFSIPKSRSLNFDKTGNFTGIFKQNESKSHQNLLGFTDLDIIDLQHKLKCAEKEVNTLTRRNDILELDVSLYKRRKEDVQLAADDIFFERNIKKVEKFMNIAKAEKKVLENEINKSKEMLLQKDDMIKNLTESLAKSKEDHTKKIDSIKSKNTQLMNRNTELTKYRDNLTANELKDLEVYQIMIKLESDESANYEDFKKRILQKTDINTDVNNNNHDIELDFFMRLSYSQKAIIKKLETEKLSIYNDVDEKLELYKNCSVDLSTEIDKKKEHENYIKELEAHQNWLENNMEFLNERLKMYENFESDNTRRDVKLMFKEFDECITYVKEMASKMIRNEHRVPFESFLIKNDSMFSSIDSTSDLNILNPVMLEKKLSELQELKRNLNLLTIDTGIYKQ